MAADETDGHWPPVVVPDKPYGFGRDAFDLSLLPDADVNFLSKEDLEAFIAALSAPDPATAAQHGEEGSTYRLGSPVARTSFDRTHRQSSVVAADARPHLDRWDDAKEVAAHAAAAAADVSAPSTNGISGAGPPQQQQQQHPQHPSQQPLFITAQNDWAPVHERVARGKKGGKRRHKRPKAVRPGRRTKDETREGYLYGMFKYPFLLFSGCSLLFLSLAYVLTRYYVWLYEYFVSWRGRREQLRRNMRATGNYRDWRAAARQLDEFLGNTAWKETNQFAYYDWKTVKRVWDNIKTSRAKAEAIEKRINDGDSVEEEERKDGEKAVEALRDLLAACVKHDWVGIENPRLYSQTYYGTKNLVQNHVDEVEKSLKFILETRQMKLEEKRQLFKSLHANYGRTALCLSGGATFAYYHFGVVKALLEEDLLPDVITGTSGGALVAGLIATRTNEELKQLLTPALAHKITACSDPFLTWFWRWYKTGARFDSVDWAKKSSWFTRGSMTFREAYQRTGRILNVSCVPADPHSPTMLCNYLTSPDCVVWSAVLASAAVPGILNPVVLMMKQRDGTLVPYSFGHKWKDGSLRTDIPLKALNLHFNVNFTIVSQVNPHINLFFYSSRGSVGQPVTHRKGRGWRGGFLGTAAEQYIKLEMTKWLKIMRSLELLPRFVGQDWSQIWLQQGFGGTITIWPRSKMPQDLLHILTDPTPARMARMLHEGQQSAYPTVKFVANRLKVERIVERGRRETRGLELDMLGAGAGAGAGGIAASTDQGRRRRSIGSIISEEDLRSLLRGSSRPNGGSSGAGGVGGLIDSVTGTEDETTADELELDDYRLGGGISGGAGSGIGAEADECAVVEEDDEFEDDGHGTVLESIEGEDYDEEEEEDDEEDEEEERDPLLEMRTRQEREEK
ncbi:acyl transferase/acyl hydrolase/lysophospholipase [Coniella lustricola]|uniref:Acyl transferase/acyl hydrolase/lysophospholipase n=1 Tax=Coniella lustricola TaxID=2025994 RepID=A0A2T3AE57_9PEZI|nr:acyl transferase/acyl hydrolase/lysophospholipase [Coniella lustricola]